MKYYYQIVNDKIVIIDELKRIVESPTITVDYRTMPSRSVFSPGELAVPTYTIAIDENEARIPVELLGKEIVAIDDFGIDNLLSQADVIGTLEYPNKKVYYIADNGDIHEITDTILDTVGAKVLPSDIADGDYTVALLEDLWSEQDDGMQLDVQMAATYLALSKCVSLLAGDRDLSKSLFDLYNYSSRELRKKYNSYKDKQIFIRPYSF